MSKLIQELFKDGFLQKGEFENNPVYHLTTPCRFNISQDVVKVLKDKYLSDEEIGGILWAKPTNIDKEKVYQIATVSFIRNDIEDSPYYDKEGKLRTRKNTYRPDKIEYVEELNKIFTANMLPIKFHTHPTKGRNVLDDINIQQVQTETSPQDHKESVNTQKLGNHNLLMPRALIVGNGDFGNDIFIGLYNGFIAPVGFKESKVAVQQENIQQLEKAISATTFK